MVMQGAPNHKKARPFGRAFLWFKGVESMYFAPQI
ncbi:hypothetical protein C5L21_000992 [Leuconostoc citreum]|nr:hypothetical protein C5L21_000992 [Leuconostoc citreum]